MRETVSHGRRDRSVNPGTQPNPPDASAAPTNQSVEGNVTGGPLFVEVRTAVQSSARARSNMSMACSRRWLWSTIGAG
jgi:hypothetical protein